MNLAQLFKPVEKIVGLEITQGFFHAVLIERNKKGALRFSKKKTSLPAGVIAGGAIVDPAALGAALKLFVQTGRDVFRSRNIILAIPGAVVFTDTMQFPQLAHEQIAESLALNLKSAALFPLSANEVYSDWQPTYSVNPMYQGVLVSLAPRAHVRAYQNVCERAGLEPVAFESPQASVARAVSNFKNKPGIVIRLLDEGVEFSLIPKGELGYARFVSLPDTLASLDDFKIFVRDETFRTLAFFQAEQHQESAIASATVISSFAQKRDIASFLSRELGLVIEEAQLDQSLPVEDSFVAAYGAALRGLISREEDTLVSVLPVGTEETYRSRRFLAYASLWSDIINTTAVLLVIVFGVAYLWLSRIHAGVKAEAARAQTTGAAQAQVSELEGTIARFNTAAGELALLDTLIFPWSNLLERVADSLAFDGITIHRISAPSRSEGISVSLTANTRDTAIAFKKALEASGIYERVEMPFLSVIQRENIQTNIVLYPAP